MSLTKNADGSISIATMSLIELLPLVVQAVKDGYDLDLESNQGTPQVIGSLHLLSMFKPKAKVAAVETVKTAEAGEPTEVVAPKIDGRKKKV